MVECTPNKATVIKRLAEAEASLKKLQQAVNAAFAPPEAMTAAFVMTWRGQLSIVCVAREGKAEGCLDSRGQRAHSAMTLEIKRGQRFGTLTVINGERRGWCARCDCGALRFVASNALASGRTRSSGCLRKSRAGEALTAERLREVLSYNPKTGLLTRRIRCGRIARCGTARSWDT